MRIKLWIDFDPDRLSFVRLWREEPPPGRNDRHEVELEVGMADRTPLFAYLGFPGCEGREEPGRCVRLEDACDLVVTANPGPHEAAAEDDGHARPVKLVEGEWVEV